MIITRKAEERGHANHGWLNSYHTFSFASYYDPKHMGLSALRVINDDTVAPGGGFGTHPHQDMEIISYVLDGELEHKDSMGNGSIIKVGDVQRMSAGTGITHSEFNPSASNETHFLQIWILPDEQGIKPSYEQIQFSEADKRGRLRLIASPDGQDGSVTIHQDAKLYSSILESGDAIRYTPAQKRVAWLHVAKGELTLNDMPLKAGDGVQADNGDVLELNTDSKAEVLLFDLPGA